MLEKKGKLLNNIILFLSIIFLFLLSKRGGDSKDIVALILMGAVAVYSYKNGIEKYLQYKKEIIIGIIYMLLVAYSYYITPDKNSDNFYTFTHMTIFSVGLFLVMLNFKIKNKHVKYILPVLLLISFPSVYRGILDAYKHYNELNYYRLDGGVYTSRYQMETGLYFLLGLFSFFYYKKRNIKFILMIYTVVNFILMLLTQSRNALLGVVITLFFIGLIVNWKKNLMFSLAIFILLGLSFKYYNNKVVTINRINSSITSIEKIRSDVRYKIYTYGISHIKDNLVKGKGFYFYREGALGKEMGEDNEPFMHYHNIFLETSITQGFITAIFYFLFLTMIFIKTFQNYFKENDRSKKIIKLWGVAVFIFTIAHGMFETVSYFEKLYQLFFTILAIVFIIDDEGIGEKI